jgi:hypothetical protein
MTDLTFRVAINEKYRGKVIPGDGRFRDFNMTFQNKRLTLSGLLETIRAGHAWTAPHRHVQHHRPTRRRPDYHTTYRVKANVTGSQLLALDSDTEDIRSDFDTLLADPFIGHYAALLHATASSTPERPRSRIIFLLEEALDRDAYEEALKALLHRYPFCDRSVSHAAVVFYGAEDCPCHLTEHILPLEALGGQIIHPYAAFREAQRRKREAERQARLAAYGNREEPVTGQVTRYVEATYDNLLGELAGTPAGQGLRHKRLYNASVTIGGLASAPWLTADARGVSRDAPEDLLAAATSNGYIADYGEDDAWRTIENGLARGEEYPPQEPVWYAQRPFFQVGDRVKGIVKGEVKGRGRVTRLRETTHWEYELDARPNVWFARELLEEKDAGDSSAE